MRTLSRLLVDPSTSFSFVSPVLTGMIGLHLKDVSFMYEALPKHMTDFPHFINFAKCWGLFETINRLQRLQRPVLAYAAALQEIDPILLSYSSKLSAIENEMDLYGSNLCFIHGTSSHAKHRHQYSLTAEPRQ